MSNEDTFVFRGVAILTANVEDQKVIVSFYGGEDNVCDAVAMSPEDPEATASVLRSWSEIGVLITIIATNGKVVITPYRP